MKKLQNKYNQPDSLIMISLYPKQAEIYSAGTSGVASYTKNIVSRMNRQVILLADTSTDKYSYEEENVLVSRCFKTNSPKMWVDILKEILKFNNVKNIALQLDFAVYGSFLTTAMAIPFLLILKIMRYNVFVIMHHVVTDIFNIKGHVGLGDGKIDTAKGYLYNFIFHSFYRVLGFSSDKVIVLEEILRDRLKNYIPQNKVITIPHGVDTTITSIGKEEARRKLEISKDDHIVLFFGFVNWFKGADFFAETYKNTAKLLGKKARFILAGGKSPTMKNNGFYNKYYDKVLDTILSSGNIEIKGYVPPEKIGLYFSAADLVVLPYRNFMTASGVFSLALSYRKPFIVSEELSQMFDESDFRSVFKKVGLDKKDISFPLDKKRCIEVTEKVLKNGLRKKMIDAAEELRNIRSYNNVAVKYESVIFEKSVNLSTLTHPLIPAYEYTK